MQVILLLLVFGLITTGCNRVSENSKQPVTVFPAQPDPEKDLANLNEAVRGYGMTKFRKPDKLEDLVKAGMIDRLPSPPAGKKYVLDDKKNSALLVDQ